jgi:glycosyltransferase involved in cell wall biosynthesis
MNETNPRVSIGMPVYNGENYLRESLTSILSQTFQDFELIISDNASTDSTETICREYAAKDGRVRYYRNDNNIGAGPNHNRVFELARGEYFKWAAYDDICAPDFLSKAVATLDSNPRCVLCYARAVIVDKHGNKIRDYNEELNLPFSAPHERFRHYHDAFSYDFGRCNPIYGLIKTSVLKKTPLIASYTASDMILLGELALYGEFNELSEPLFFRRYHEKGSGPSSEWRNDKYASWFDPKNRGKIFFPRWRWFFEYLRAVGRVKMDIREKLLCYFEMIKWILRYYKGMVYDLLAGIIVFFRLSEDPYKLQRLFRKHFPKNTRKWWVPE